VATPKNELPDYLGTLLRQRGKLVRVGLTAALVALILTFLLPPKYRSTASLLPTLQESSFGSVFANPAQLYAGIGSTTGGLVNEKSSSDLWVGILNSRSVQEVVVKRGDLIDAFDVETVGQAITQLKKQVNIKKQRDEILHIMVEDADPKRAAAIANAYVDALNYVNQTVVTTTSSRVRAFVERRLAETKADLARAEKEIRAFQNRHRTVHLPEQSEAIIDSVGRINAEIIAKEVVLTTLLSYATPTHPQAELLKTEIAKLKREAGRMEGHTNSAKSVYIPTGSLPDITAQYAHLQRDLKMREGLYDLLVQQYEMARIQEAKNSVAVHLLDRAVPAEEPASSGRPLIVVAVTLAALFFTLLASFVSEYLRAERGGLPEPEKGSRMPIPTPVASTLHSPAPQQG
jgi:uncharacterized protein involved in exopolysaccharide biosynthesis